MKCACPPDRECAGSQPAVPAEFHTQAPVELHQPVAPRERESLSPTLKPSPPGFSIDLALSTRLGRAGFNRLMDRRSLIVLYTLSCPPTQVGSRAQAERSLTVGQQNITVSMLPDFLLQSHDCLLD